MGKRKKLYGAAKAARKRKKSGKRVSVAREKKIRERCDSRLAALKKLQLNSADKICRAIDIRAERDRELAGLPPVPAPKERPTPSFIGQKHE